MVVVWVVRVGRRVVMPVPVLAELRFGFLNGTRGRENEAHLLRFLDHAGAEGFLRTTPREVLVVESDPDRLLDGMERWGPVVRRGH